MTNTNSNSNSELDTTQARPRKNAIALWLTWGAYLGLLLMMVITSLPGYLPEGSSPLVIMSIKLIPLLIVLPGLIKDNLRAFTWLCFIVLFYFTQSVVEAFLSLGANVDLVITLLTISIFLSAMFYIKWERALGRPLF